MKGCVFAAFTLYLLIFLSINTLTFTNKNLFVNGDDADDFDSETEPATKGFIDEYDYSETDPSKTKVLESSAEIEAFIAASDIDPSIVGYFDGTSEFDLKVFQEIATRDSKLYRFAYTTNMDVLIEKGFEGSVVFAHPITKDTNAKLERPKHRYPTKSLNKRGFENFVHEKVLPLVGEVNDDSKKRYNHAKLPQMILYTTIDHKKNQKGYMYLINRLHKVANQLSGERIVFAVADKNKFIHDFKRNFKFGKPKEKDMMIGIRHGRSYHTMNNTFSIDGAVQFYHDFKLGLIPKHEKVVDSGLDDDDEEVPSYVQIVTNKNFTKIVEDSKKDVLIEFFAEWCGHCKIFKSEYKKVANAFKDDPGVLIVAMDEDKYKPPAQYVVQEYPSIFFKAANKKDPEFFNGPKQAQAIVSYINLRRATKKAMTEDVADEADSDFAELKEL